MNRTITDQYTRIPDLHARLEQAARLERSRAIAAGLTRLGQYAKAQLALCFQFGPTHWMERLG